MKQYIYMAASALAVVAALSASLLLLRPTPASEAGSDKSKPASAASLKKKNASLKSRLDGLKPKGTYLVVDTARNILELRKSGTKAMEARISAGSGNVLDDPSGNRQWVFDTPHGEFSIRSKQKDPVWIKPDWAFIEEGQAPPPGMKDRYEEGVLGDYAMGFGNGFFIHGTLYTRLIGYNVTHGCIRVGDDDLKEIFAATPIGTRLFIF